MSIIRKHRITPQEFEDVLSYGYTVAQIAREAGIDRITLSKFRNHGAPLKAADQAALIVWLQANELWDDESGDATAIAPNLPTRDPAEPANMQVLPRPKIAVTIGGDVAEEDAARLATRAEEVIEDIKRLVAGKLTYDDFLIFEAGKPDENSQAAHQQLVSALAEFALLQFRMQGNDLAPPLSPQLAEAGARLTTHAELLASEFPWPVGEPNPAPASNPSAKSLAAGTEGEGRERDQAESVSKEKPIFDL